MANAKMIVVGVLALGVVAAAYYAKNKIGGMIPVVVQDGFEATGQITGNFLHMLTDPLDAFGIVPPTTHTWLTTTPWETPVSQTNDPVSNNDSGMNFNYF